VRLLKLLLPLEDAIAAARKGDYATALRLFGPQRDGASVRSLFEQQRSLARNDDHVAAGTMSSADST
jgi:hypothetical protein